jgi:radical SAM superfamily enzyme YgiQ (UPF0313 family)
MRGLRPPAFAIDSGTTASMSAILLATLNARYIHASLGLRYLLANLGDLKPQATLHEYTIKRPALEIVEDLLNSQPQIIGFGVYIWNVIETTRVVAMLKAVAPEVMVVLGGPEVSHETAGQEIVGLADYVISGPGEVSFALLCQQILAGTAPAEKVIVGEVCPLDQLVLPYREYSDEDIAHRFIYVEASRGCPFKCEFCLSALDKTAKPFELERFLQEMAALHTRGVRHFKFVDRTFNLNVKTGVRILEFFLARLDDTLFLHFEVIPDHLPDALKTLITRFPPGSLQFEVGVQTFNPNVQALISRKQDNVSTEVNLRWLRQHSQAHLHVDLIIGLPGEDMESFGQGFDRLLALGPHEIQVGILKRLRGTPIVRHTKDYGMRYNPLPPYDILATDCIQFATLRRLARFARYWDMVANSGRFTHTLPLLLGDSPFARWLQCSDWLYAQTGMTGDLALDRLFRLLYEGSMALFEVEENTVRTALELDFNRTGNQGKPRFLRNRAASESVVSGRTAARQERHGG